MADAPRLSALMQPYTSPEALARHAAGDCSGERRAQVLAVCKLLFAVAENDFETIRLIRSEAFDEETLRLRRAVIWVAKLHTNASLPEIGRAINRDHSVVQRSIEETKVIWLADMEFRALCERIRGRTGAPAPVTRHDQAEMEL
ncbi:chromosomal replication initiation ATPase DnaA [Sphingomonas naasensis]|nr:helix-turn-helix domain-containing protein [Sphingomonas naasensis]NIJ18463.1 chromosomal replication initiation ATPase DnaA [Sphingomonas naasensis]